VPGVVLARHTDRFAFLLRDGGEMARDLGNNGVVDRNS